MSVKVTKKERKAAKTYDRYVAEMATIDDKNLSDTAKEMLKKFIPEPIPYDIKIDEEAIERLITSRISLLLNKPFFGNLATRLILRNADEWLPTAATDGRYFYYNSRFVMSLTPKEVDFLVGHEVLHVVYDHMGRRGDRHPQLWNIANDYLVNWDLVEENVGEKIHTVPILYDAKYQGMASEEVFDILYAKAKEQQKKNQQQKGDQGEGDGEGDGQGQPGQPGQGGKPSKGKGQSNNAPTEKDIRDALGDAIDKVLDEHLTGEEEGDGNGGGDGEDGKGTSGPVPMTDAEKRALKDEVREAVLQAAEQAGAGNVPGNVKRMIQELTEPKIDWRELIAQQIESIVKADFSWQRPSRRSAHMDAIMPGTIPGNQIDVCVAVDTSGSVSTEMLRDFMTEIQGIMEQFDEYNLHVWCFDTSIYNPQKFTHDNAMDMVDYEPEGFGGTDFEVNWEWMKEEDIEPKKLIFFTDGYPCGGWGDPDYCETVWVIHGPKTIEPPFGIWAFYDEQ